MNHHSPTVLSAITATLLFTSGSAMAELSNVSTATSTITQMTDYVKPPEFDDDLDARDQNISNDGNKVIFVSTADLTGQGTNPDNLENLFVMNTDGTGLRQLTHVTINTIYPNGYDAENDIEYSIKYHIRKPQLSADGSVVVFASTNNFLFDEEGNPLNPPGEAIESYPGSPDYVYMTTYNQIFVMNTDGTGLKQLTNANGNSITPSISHAGDVVVFMSDADLIGENSDGNFEIYAAKTDGSRLSQITRSVGNPLKRHDSRDPDISGDGTTVAFDSYVDLIPPLNDDLSDEIFVFDLVGFWRNDAATADHSNYTVQITNSDIDHPDHSVEENSFEASLSYDGSWVAFAACINPGAEGIYKEDRTVLGNNPYLPDVLYIAKRDGTELTQLTFSDDPNAYIDEPEESTWTQNDDDIQRPQISDDGRRIVFASRSRVDIINEENNFEIAMIDLDAPSGPDGRPDVEQLTHSTLNSGPYVLQLSFENTDGRKFDPKISGNAGKILFRADSNFTGSNPDENKEVYMIEPDYIKEEEWTANLGTPFDDSPVEETSTEEATNDDDNTVVDTQPEDTATDNNTQPVTSDTEKSLDNANDKSGGAAAFGFSEILLALLCLGGLGSRRRH